jgi:hypothetical protein
MSAQLTRRDEAMLDWLGIVRVADVHAIRYALAGFAGTSVPVTMRRAQQWILRMLGTGLIDRARPTFRDESIVWATRDAVGLRPPNLYRQTARHEVAVAAASARYIAQGYRWTRDRKPTGLLDHQADGVAVKGDIVELIEVEMTQKTRGRYRVICDSHAFRMEHEGIARVAYLCSQDAARSVSREADRFLLPAHRVRLVSLNIFDVHGRVTGDLEPLWQHPPEPGSGQLELAGFDCPSAQHGVR